MPNWSGGILTTKGQALQAKVDAGQTLLTLTKMKIGSGVLPSGQSLQSLNDLVVPEMNVPISAVSAEGNISTITGVITNAGLTNGFNVRELGVFAQDPTLGEILYSITTDSTPDYLPPEGGAVTVSSEFNYHITVSNAANVTATLNPSGLVTVSILQQHKTASILDHPDNSVTDAKIGNRTITDTVTAAAGAGTLTNLLSKLGNMIKQITGKSAWYTAPATTLQALSDLIVSTPGANKLLKLDANSKLPADVTGNAATATKLATARKINTVPFDGSADINLTPAQIGAAPKGYGVGERLTPLSSGYDLNTLVLSGMYIVPNPTNGPLADSFQYGVIVTGGSLFTSQMLVRFESGKTLLYHRHTVNSGSTWSAYKQLATTDQTTYVVTSSIGINGYRKWSDGLIEQWGVLSNVALNSTFHSVTFPLAFPSAAYNVQATIGMDAVVTDSISPIVKSILLTGFSVAGDQGAVASTGNIFWSAIGY